MELPLVSALLMYLSAEFIFITILSSEKAKLLYQSTEQR
jgi:hypothetical protein